MDQRKEREERRERASTLTEEQERDIQGDQPHREGDDGEHFQAEDLEELAQAVGGLEGNAQTNTNVNHHHEHTEDVQALGDGVKDEHYEEGSEEEEVWITQKLTQLPVFVHGMERVWNRYQEVKNSNVIFDISFDMTEFMAHLSIAVVGPCLCRRFQPCMVQANYFCCVCVDCLVLKIPVLSAPADVMEGLAGCFTLAGMEETEEETGALNSNEVTADTIHGILYQLLPACRQHHPAGLANGEPALTRKAQRLAGHIADTKWDLVKALKLVIVLTLALILKLFSAGVALIVKGPRLGVKGVGALARHADDVWNRCIDVLPASLPKAFFKSPLRKVGALVVWLVWTVGKLFRPLHVVRLLPRQLQ
ncbi:hypothetical protein ACOMHN_007260 [Nucella lapillus]